jgi:hypothetical protein
MLLSIVSVVCIGVLLGLRLRVASILAASVVLVMVSAVLMPLFTEWSLLNAVGFLFVLLSVLQCGYLVGAFIAFNQTRTRSAGNVGLEPVGRLGSDELPRMRHGRGARLSHH